MGLEQDPGVGGCCEGAPCGYFFGSHCYHRWLHAVKQKKKVHFCFNIAVAAEMRGL